MVGKSFDASYVLKDKLKIIGSFGTLYEGQSKTEKKNVLTIKVIDKTKDKQNEEMAKNEYTVLKTMEELKSPYIMKISDYITDDKSNTIYMISSNTKYEMTVADRLALKGMYKETEAQCLISLLFETVQHIHTKKVVHRNIIPENIILNTKNDCTSFILYNFNYAKLIPSSGCKTLVGHPEYIAPEVVNGQPYHEKADIWMIGCVIYNILTSMTPFKEPDDDNDKICSRIKKGDYVPFTDPFFGNHFGDDVTYLLSILLVVDAKKRSTIEDALQCNWFKGMNSQQLKELYFKHNKLELSTSTGEPFQKVYAMDNEIEAGRFSTLYSVHYQNATANEKNKKHYKQLLAKKIDRTAFEEQAMNEKVIYNELRTLCNKSDSNVLPLYDFKMDHEYIYFITNIPNNTYTIEESWKNINFTEDDTRLIITQMIDTLNDLHNNHRMVHRNLKPESILVIDNSFTNDKKLEDVNYDTYKPNIKKIQLCKFDYAKILPLYNKELGLKTIVGIPEYQAPEMILVTEDSTYFETVDMWSVGCILFLLLGKDTPFGDISEYDYQLELLQNAITSADYNFERAKAFKTVSTEGKDLITNLLKVDPKERWTAKQCLSVQCKWIKK